VNYIAQLQLADDQAPLTSQYQIIEAFTTHYRNLLGSRDGDVNSRIPPGLLRPHQNLESLIVPFNEDEIKDTVFSLAKEKACGPNGLRQISSSSSGRNPKRTFVAYYRTCTTTPITKQEKITLVKKKA